MSSFYGGKQGRTYHIVARYDCVDLTNYDEKSVFINFEPGNSYTKGQKIVYDNEYYVILANNISTVDDLYNEEKTYHVRGMVQQFAKGGAYTEANYGEYVLIDTIFNLNHKSDLENGLLYRRGFDYNQSSKEKPDIEDYYDERNNLKKDLWQAAWDSWVQKPGAGAIYVGQIVGPQGESPELTPVKWENLNSKASRKTVVPSSRTEGNDHTQILDDEGNIIINDKGDPIWAGDAIKVGSYTVRDYDGNIIGAEIAFDIPITVIDAPDVNINGISYKGSAEENDISKDHPFYYKWNFYIPQVTDLTKELGSQISNSYSIDGQGNNIIEEDEYITYEVYNANAAGAISAHLGRWPYRVINDVSISSHNRVFISLNSGTLARVGDLYNFNVTSSSGNLVCAVCILEGTVDPDQIPMIKYDGDPGQYTPGTQSWSGNSKWRVIEIPSTAPASSMIIDYKAGANTLFTDKLRNVDFLTVDSKGNLYVRYSDKPNEKFYLTNINGLESVTLDDYGINIVYTNGSTNSFPIKQINSIELQNQDNIEQSQKFIVNYKDKTIQEISDDLNTILAIEMQGDNIVALYSDPTYRSNFSEDPNNKQGKDWFLRPWVDPITGTSYIDLVWINLTSPKGSYHVQGEYTYSDLKGDSSASDFTINLSNGFGQITDLQDRVGWLVTVKDTNNKRIFAFDYNDSTVQGKHTIEQDDGTTFTSHWYEIFSLADSAIRPELLVAVSSASGAQPSLNNNGLWFVTYPGHDRI